MHRGVERLSVEQVESAPVLDHEHSARGSMKMRRADSWASFLWGRRARRPDAAGSWCYERWPACANP